MVSATERIASGELSERLPEQKGGDELSIVSQSFNRMTEQLQLTISRQRALVRYSLDAIIVLDCQGTVVEFNPAAERIFGCTAEFARNRFFPKMAIASPWTDQLQQDLQLADREAAACLVGRWQEVEALRSDGSRFPAEMSITNIELEGNVLFTVTLRDITERQQAALRLQQSEERFRQIVYSAPIGIALTDTDSDRQLIRQVNPAWCKIVGYEEEELLGWPMEKLGLTFQNPVGIQTPDSELVHAGPLLPADVRSVDPPPLPRFSLQRLPSIDSLPQPPITPSPIPSISSHLTSSCPIGNYQTEQRYRRKDGREIWIGLTVTALSGGGNDRTNLAMIEDITERKLIELQLRHEALHDALTGLPNRTLLLKRLSRACDRYHSFDSGNDFAVLFLDCDRFKDINDRLGHEVGDKLLIALAHRLESCVREGDTVARMGGDEFTLLVEHIHDPDESTMVADRIVKALKSPFVFGVHQIVATVSIGIVNSHPRYSNPDDILKDADEAMYRAKMGGRAQHVLYVNDADCRD